MPSKRHRYNDLNNLFVYCHPIKPHLYIKYIMFNLTCSSRSLPLTILSVPTKTFVFFAFFVIFLTYPFIHKHGFPLYYYHRIEWSFIVIISAVHLSCTLQRVVLSCPPTCAWLRESIVGWIPIPLRVQYNVV